jgi:CotH protein
MKTRRTKIALTLCAVLCSPLLGLAPASALAVAEPPPGEAGWMYEAGTVVAIDLELTQAKKEELEDEPDEYVAGTLSLSKTDGTPGGAKTPVVTSRPVEVKLKGNVLGSFRTLDKKAAFKLKFKKSEPFLGLRKMTLNNMVEDYSSIHETLAYRVFRAAGIAAPRTGFAWVRLNGEDFGLYLNLENLDKVNLERWFGTFQEPPQHLYEGEDGVDVEPGRASEYEVDEGEEADRADLEALIASANSDLGPGWSGHVSSRIDLGEMTRMWAVEKYVGHWDGYSGEETPLRPNNYYLYSDASGRFQMLPWGTDNTWEPFKKPDFEGDAGLLFDDCMADPSCATVYRDALRELQTTVASLDLDDFAAGTADLLEPWEELEQSNSRNEHSLDQIASAVSETRDFIAERPGELADWLDASEEEPGGNGGPGGDGSGSGGTSGAGAAGASMLQVSSLPAPEPARLIRIVASAVDGGALVTKLRLQEEGTVSQRVTLRRAGHEVSACSAHKRHATESVTLRCSLSAAVRRYLRAGSLHLEVSTSFSPTTGDRQTIVKKVIAQRDRSL